MKKNQEVEMDDFDLESLTGTQRKKSENAQQWTVSTSNTEEMARLEKARQYAEKTRGRSLSKVEFFRMVVNDWIDAERKKRD